VTERELEQLTIADIGPRLRSGEVSPVELTERYLERIQRLNPLLNAYLTVTADRARAEAAAAAKEIQAGHYRGPLHGIPVSIKDNLATRDVRTTAGSIMLDGWKPDFDATVVTRLREAGAVMLGKTNMHEWAKGSHSVNPFYGTPYNPWDPTRIPGGSSSGSGVAVAASLCLASIGTDAAGSVRNPASLCGVVGLKPTYGRVSVFGGVPGTGGYSTNHFGILTRNVRDCATVLQVIAGHDPQDPLSSKEPVPEYQAEIGTDLKGIRAGVIKGYFDAITVDEVKEVFSEALGTMRSLGVTVEEVSVPHMDLIPAVQLCASRAESTSDHEKYLRTRPRDYSPGMLATQIGALTVPASLYTQSQRIRRLICDGFDRVLEDVDVILAPTTPIPAPPIEECKSGTVEVDGRSIRLQDRRGNFLTMCTIPFNVNGLPTLSLPCGFSREGMPIGMQVASGAFREATVLRVAHAYEQAAPWAARRPDLE
jgi:aspartyl-tRNA(Asn)/glutamyl-tRNA(Gln) amidotransferase subunit A